jgi:hypothetical protein
MGLPNLKLAVPDLPGYYLHWHRGANVRKALKAGYTHVEDYELDIEQTGVANASDISGSSDMGSNISIPAGASDTISDTNLEPERLYLMKLPWEWHEKDMMDRTKANESIAATLRAGLIGAEGDSDRNKRYMKAGQDLFYPKAKKA